MREEGPDWVLRNGVGRLAPTPIERLATVEQFLEDLEKGGFGINNVRFLRAKFYLSLTDPGWIAEHLQGAVDVTEADARAIRTLRTIMESGDAAASARATGMLAAHHLATKRYTDARAHVMSLRAAYPDADWNWVAALRIAQIHERLGRKTAVAEYEALATRPKLPPAAALLSRISAAELRERSGDLPAANAHYRAALEAWGNLSDRINVNSPVDHDEHEQPVFARFIDFKKADLMTRLDRLSKVVSTEEALLYEGRRAIENGAPRHAIAPLAKLVRSYPNSRAAVEGRGLLRRAQFADLLATPQPGVAAADRALASMAGGPYDTVTTFAKLARAALKLRGNANRSEVEALTRQALEEWHLKQPTAVDSPTTLAQDVAAIRAELFLPRGGGVFGHGRWNAFEWPKETLPFAIVSRDIQVKTEDGKEQRLSAPFTAKMDGRVLFATDEDLSLMRMILDKIGGTETAEWVGIMDTPNQPIGGSAAIAAVWSKLFPIRPGHWGGWELTIYPYVTKITFDRENHALADFTAGYSGGTVELVKEDGVWIAKRIVNFWIT